MAERFLGLKVSVLLHSGAKIEGVFCSIEPNTQQLTLRDVTLYFFGQPPHHAPIHGIYGKDIKDLHTDPLQQAEQSQEALLPVNKSVSTFKNKKKKQQYQQHQQQQQQQHQHSPRNNRKNTSESWANKDVSSYREEEFDFQKNLNMFDKAKVFAEIRESDKTSQDDLLVSFNRLPQRNLLPTENVLDTPETIFPIRSTKKKSKIQTTENHIDCPTLSVAVSSRIEQEYSKVSKQREGLIIQNSAKGATILATRLLRYIGTSTSIVVLAGNNKNGTVGLAMARMLASRGYSVTICLVCQPGENLRYLALLEENTLRNLGATIVDSPSSIQGDYDLVVDAILGPENKLMDNLGAFHAITESINWANRQNKPVMSIDFPSGIDADTGTPQHPEYIIHPKWTISLGVPKIGCTSAKVTGELCLVDVGIPRYLLEQEGTDMKSVFSDSDVLVNLTYDTTQ
ncbi:hypothetical protein G6F56_000190 [Rhizopus delemar]|uniref:Enhancer of mRNA-decapping protein 3 n=1 Tax=Rhizopus stolonifer TaxID=4846 RepID=A0A367KX43_RHIST|nr:hypothetical protein G6F56_000190 [Rhizopus delemar]RCI06734.1 enhancer of mRNA decapping [Rhizopus stolonifer]